MIMRILVVSRHIRKICFHAVQKGDKNGNNKKKSSEFVVVVVIVVVVAVVTTSLEILCVFLCVIQISAIHIHYTYNIIYLIYSYRNLACKFSIFCMHILCMRSYQVVPHHMFTNHKYIKHIYNCFGIY